MLKGNVIVNSKLPQSNTQSISFFSFFFDCNTNLKLKYHGLYDVCENLKGHPKIHIKTYHEYIFRIN